MAYSDIFGSGNILFVQLLTIIVIILSIFLWIGIYKKLEAWERFKKTLLFPLILWIVFGILDIVITARGTYFYPSLEGNPATRFFIETFGIFGASIASFLWISLWAGIMASLLVNVKHKAADFLCAVILYTLAFGHILGFGSWMEITRPSVFAFKDAFGITFGRTFVEGVFPTKLLELIPGLILAIIHFAIYSIKRKS